MTLTTYLVELAPEWILLFGACAALLIGLFSVRGAVGGTSGFALGVIVAALVATLMRGVPDGTFASLGLHLTSLTFYARILTLSIGALVVLINWFQPKREECGEFMSMVLFSLLGVMLTASCNDWLILFLALELVSIPTYVLVALSQEDARASEAAVKYFFLGALAAAVTAYGISFLYGASGTTAMFAVTGANVTSRLPLETMDSGYLVIGLILLIAGLAFKVAAVPLHVYAPDVYEGAASSVTAMLGFVPKFAGFLALMKVAAAFEWRLPEAVWWIVWIIAVATMTVGNVLGLLQRNVKRMLAYSSIAHTGYMLIAFLVGPVAGEGPLHDGVAALLFYVAVYGVMNLGAFALLAAFRTKDRPVETLDELAGLAGAYPGATLAFAVCVFSLMGFPPTVGFLGKLYVFSSAFSIRADHPFHSPLVALAVIGVINSAIAAAYYLRMVATAYWSRGAGDHSRAGGQPLRWGLALSALGMIVLFAWPRGLTEQAHIAAEALQVEPSNIDAKVTASTPKSVALSGTTLPRQ